MTIGADKYHIPQEEGELLPNLLGLTDRKDIEEAETEGVLEASIILIEELSNETVFDLAYLYRMHTLAFGRLYGFAGKLRTVNMSKGGFAFPSAKYLHEAIALFEKDMLLRLPNSYSDKDSLITDIAAIHAELLYIHPFREGNGRIARLLANLMTLKQGYPLLRFERIGDDQMEEYIAAVQKAADKDYAPMKLIIARLF